MLRLSGDWMLTALLIIAGYIMLADFMNLDRALRADTPEPLAVMPLPQPWGGYGWRTLSRLSGNATLLAPEVTAGVLLDAAVRYPIDARQWLDLAHLHARNGDSEAVGRSLEKAHASQPYNRSTLWRAAQIALRTGNQTLAEQHFRQWLDHRPTDTGRALFTGSRWIADAGELLDRMLPPGREYLMEAMKFAEAENDTALAVAVWERLEPKPGLDDSTFLNFLEQLLTGGEVAWALALWSKQDPHFDGTGIANGSFSRPLGPSLGLNWRTRFAPAAVRIERDTEHFFSAPASLKIEFNGKQNVNLNHPQIRVAVEPGRRYKLTGMWRAKGLTTRSLPVFRLNTPGRESLRVPKQNFDWQPWVLEFTSADRNLALLSLRRTQTDAFDRNIGGTLWLDDFRLEPIEETIGETISLPTTIPETILETIPETIAETSRRD